MEIVEWSYLHPTQSCSILAEQRHRSLCQETVSDTCKQHYGGRTIIKYLCVQYSEFMWRIVGKILEKFLLQY